MLLWVIRFFYSVLFYLLLPLLFLRLFIKSFKAPAYKQRWLERLGFFSAPKNPGGIWIHTVSVGEFLAALPLIRALQQSYPSETITITTTTPTGSARVLETLGNTVFHVYLPYDTAFGMRQFLAKVKPSLCIILETELWLNLLHYCDVRRIPVLVVNGSISPQAFGRYLDIAFLMRTMLNKITCVMAKSKIDGERYLQLGLAAEKLMIFGNIKYDLIVSPSHLTAGKALKDTLYGRVVLIAASTHEGEEQAILAAFGRIRERLKSALLILVPRHPERFEQVANLIQQHGFSMIRRSLQEQCFIQDAVMLGDTMGELNLLYQAADVAFVGGSLVPVGGHNALEAAIANLPVVMGPYLHKCLEVSETLLATDAMMIVKDSIELYNNLLKLLSNKQLRVLMGANAKQVVMCNQGATAKSLQKIQQIMEQIKESQ